MLARFSLGLGAWLTLSILSGCGSRPGCVIDTDCPLGQLCSTDQRCEMRGGGGGGDSGGADAARVDAGDAGSVDAGSTDARVDAPATDSGRTDSAADTGSADAGACMGPPGVYTLTSSPAACPTPISMITVAAAASACMVTLSSRDEPTFGGTVTSTGGSTFTGALSVGAMSFPRCTVTFSGLGLSVDCGAGCVLPATGPT